MTNSARDRPAIVLLRHFSGSLRASWLALMEPLGLAGRHGAQVVARVNRRVTGEQVCPHHTMACSGVDVGGIVTDGADSPAAVGPSDRAKAVALQPLPGWWRLRLNTWVALATANGQAREWAGDERRRKKAEHGGIRTPHSWCALGTVLGIGMDEVGSFFWCSRARRLVGLVTWRLGGPSAHRPGGRDPGTGVTSQRAIGPQNPAGGTFAWLV